MAPHQDKNRIVHATVAGAALLVFLLDAFTPLGYAEWVFYIVPVALCTLQNNRNFALAVVAVLMPMMLGGYYLSPPGADPVVAIFNRCMAFVVVAGVAYLARTVITERVRAQHLMWLERGRAEVSRNMLGELTVPQVSGQILQAVARYVDAQVAVLYRVADGKLECAASFGLDEPCSDRELAAGAGLAGEVAKSGQPLVVRDLPQGYLRIGSATSGGEPGQVVIVPVSSDGQVTGVMEFGFLRRSAMDEESELLGLVSSAVASALKSAQYREDLRALLEQTQHQAEELQTQQEELRVTNEELEEQSRALMESQAMLENQQAELEQTNLQLSAQAEQLETQTRELLGAKETLEHSAEELGRANQYKSEFLANMSHELRTPLNSSLILSKILMDNKKGTLDEEQVRYARTIYSSNNELLALINDILDLSKIEAGHADVQPEPVAISSVVASLRDMFEQVAEEKSLDFRIAVSSDTPASIVTDRQRLQQVLKNLLSNAFKFTSAGEVTLQISRGQGDRLLFAVRDTGIGIAEHQQEVIFEAFRQADGTTSRKFGGTGLGLSISRELARLLGGELHVQSAPGVGSTFTLEIGLELSAPEGADGHAALPLPVYAAAPPQARSAVKDEGAAPQAPAVPDDRNHRSRERLILVIEDDLHFSTILYDLAHELNFDCLVANSGAEAVRLAREYAPSGILLDVGLPDQSGLTVLEELKRDSRTRHIPIHMISVEDHVQKALEMGAVGYAFKPVAREELVDAVSRLEQRLQHRARKVLVVEDDSTLRENLVLLLAADDIEITTAGTAAEALELVSGRTFDCVVLDLNLPDSSGYELLEKMASGGRYSFPPVIVYTGRVITREEEQQLRRYSRSIIIKGAKSPERLVDEVTLFLHRVESSIPPDQQKLLQQARQRDAGFEGRRILLVEDDVRNIFALTSVFEPLGAELKIARNGLEALKSLEQDGDMDLVLMDLMMPEMDGLTAIREIRRDPARARLPIIALTAKAMSDDRRNCMEAGANDYIAKPIDVDKLLTLCRVWMPRR
jgi:signal transduction histidine kinase/DNA-binding response OmpR family regulator